MQFLRYTHFRLEAAGEGITDDDRQRYLDSARAIVQDGLDDAEVTSKGKKAPKFHRTAAADWLMAADHQFVVVTGTGLCRFIPHSHDPRPAEQRQLVLLLLDKGSDGFCTVWYVLYFLKMRAMPVFDWAHIPYRDLDGWMTEADLKCSMRLKTIHHNFGYGPWDGESWMQQHRDTATEVQAMGITSDPCLDFWWPKICRELGLKLEETGHNDKLVFISTLPEAEWLVKQGQRVCGSRWRTFSVAETYRCGVEARRAFLLMVQGVQGVLQGWLANRKAKALMSEGLRPTSADAAGQSTKAVKKQTNAIRDRSTNTAQLVLFILVDNKVHRDVSILHYVSKQVDLGHAWMCRELRNCEAVAKFNIGQAEQNTEYLTLVGGLLQPFEHLEALEVAGFNTDFHSATLAGVTSESEEYAAEAELIADFMSKVVPGVGRLVRGHLQTGWTYPGKFFLLMSMDAEVREHGKQQIRADREAWIKIQKCGGHFWTGVVKRSPMNWTVVDETFLLLEATSYAVTPEVDAQLNRMLKHIGGTFPVECCFQKAADHADRDNSNKRLAGRKLWHTPVAEKLLSQLFDFKEVDCGEIVEAALPKSNAEAGLPERLFNFAHKDQTLDCKSLVSTSQTTKWQTYSGSTQWTLSSDQWTVSQLFSKDLLKAGPDCWKSFIFPPAILVQLSGVHYFTLFAWGSVVLFIKAEHCPAPNGVKCWKCCKAFTHNILVQPVHDFKQVQYVPMEWLSPFTSCVTMGGVLPESWAEMPVCKETGPVVPFLTGAAGEAFWSLPIASVKRLGKEQYKLNLTGSDVDVLADLITHILKCSDLELAKIL